MVRLALLSVAGCGLSVLPLAMAADEPHTCPQAVRFETQEIPSEEGYTYASFSPDGAWLATTCRHNIAVLGPFDAKGDYYNPIRVWRLHCPQPGALATLHTTIEDCVPGDRHRDMGFDPTGNWLGIIRNAPDRGRIIRLDAVSEAGSSLDVSGIHGWEQSFSADGRWLVSRYSDRLVFQDLKLVSSNPLELLLPISGGSTILMNHDASRLVVFQMEGNPVFGLDHVADDHGTDRKRRKYCVSVWKRDQREFHQVHVSTSEELSLKKLWAYLLSWSDPIAQWGDDSDLIVWPEPLNRIHVVRRVGEQARTIALELPPSIAESRPWAPPWAPPSSMAPRDQPRTPQQGTNIVAQGHSESDEPFVGLGAVVLVSPDGKWLVAVRRFDTVIWNLTADNVQETVVSYTPPAGVNYNDQKRSFPFLLQSFFDAHSQHLVLFGWQQGELPFPLFQTWQVKDRTMVPEPDLVKPNIPPITDDLITVGKVVSISPDGRWLFSSGEDVQSLVATPLAGYRVGTRQRILSHDAIVSNVACDPSGRWVATVSGKPSEMTSGGDRIRFTHYEKCVRLWDLQSPTPDTTGSVVAKYEGDEPCLVFSKDSKHLAICVNRTESAIRFPSPYSFQYGVGKTVLVRISD